MPTDDLAARERVRQRMEWVDALSPELRKCVHEFGLTIVKDFINCGVTKPQQIRHLVNSVRDGSKEVGKRETASPIADNRVAAFRL